MTYRPEFPFEHGAGNADIETPRALAKMCAPGLASGGSLSITVWIYQNALRLADHIGHIVQSSLLGSTLQDTARLQGVSGPFFWLGSVSYCSLDDWPDEVAVRFTESAASNLESVVAWYLHVGYGETPAESNPPPERCWQEARRLVSGNGVALSRHRLTFLGPVFAEQALVEAGVAAFLRRQCHRGWNPTWPQEIEVRDLLEGADPT